MKVRDDFGRELRCYRERDGGAMLSVYGPHGGHHGSVVLSPEQAVQLAAWLRAAGEPTPAATSGNRDVGGETPEPVRDGSEAALIAGFADLNARCIEAERITWRT